jgi:hypothetical protein
MLIGAPLRARQAAALAKADPPAGGLPVVALPFPSNGALVDFPAIQAASRRAQWM